MQRHEIPVVPPHCLPLLRPKQPTERPPPPTPSQLLFEFVQDDLLPAHSAAHPRFAKTRRKRRREPAPVVAARTAAAAPKKQRVVFRCDWCFTDNTPERRSGPDGRRTLCNACGLRYYRVAKMEAIRAAAMAPLSESPEACRRRMSIDNLLNDDDDDADS